MFPLLSIVTAIVLVTAVGCGPAADDRPSRADVPTPTLPPTPASKRGSATHVNPSRSPVRDASLMLEHLLDGQPEPAHDLNLQNGVITS